MGLLSVIKRRSGNQQGATLAELMIWLVLTVLLMTGVAQLLATSLTGWRMINSQTTLQQTVRFSVDSIVRDTQFARGIILDHNRLTVITNKYGKKDQRITYTYDTGARPHVLRRNKNDGSGAQPMTGGNSNASLTISDCRFTVLAAGRNGQPRTVEIVVTARDSDTDRQFTLQTAVTGRLVPP